MKSECRNPRLEEIRKKFKGKTSMSKVKPDPSILLHPNIPKPLHTVNPRSILGKEWWDKTRSKAYKEQSYHCHACGHLGDRQKGDFLEAHEHYDVNYATGRIVLVKVVALCKKCHLHIHSGLCEILLEKGDITQREHDEIIQHGFNLLLKNGLPTLPECPLVICAWDEWYLELNGKKYYSPFKNYEDWDRHWEEADYGL